jgi:hypothetical protein
MNPALTSRSYYKRVRIMTILKRYWPVVATCLALVAGIIAASLLLTPSKACGEALNGPQRHVQTSTQARVGTTYPRVMRAPQGGETINPEVARLHEQQDQVSRQEAAITLLGLAVTALAVFIVFVIVVDTFFRSGHVDT